MNPTQKPTFRMRNAALALVALALAAGAGFHWQHASAQRGAEAPVSAPVLEFMPEDLYTVQRETLVRSLPLTGTLAALTNATVKAKLAGELVEVSVREGQAVKRGQLLARIDPTEAQARVAARQADVEAARAQLSLAEKNRANQKALLDKNFISQNAFDTTLSSFEVAAARLRAAEADLVAARKSLGDAVLVAPFSGIVSERLAQPGERVPLDGRVVSLVDLSRMELAATIPSSAISRVKVGQTIAFRVDGFGAREFAGRVDRINPATTAGSRSISVYAVIENPDGALRGGLFAQGELVLERVAEALLVPGAAVRQESGKTYVYVVKDGTLARRPVKVAAREADARAQVNEGLAAGEQVVKSNLGSLREGAKVRVRGAAAGPAGAAAPAR